VTIPQSHCVIISLRSTAPFRQGSRFLLTKIPICAKLNLQHKPYKNLHKCAFLPLGKNAGSIFAYLCGFNDLCCSNRSRRFSCVASVEATHFLNYGGELKMKKQGLFLILIVGLLIGMLIGFSTNVSAESSGIYTYTVSNEKVTITDCKSTASGYIDIPSEFDGYPVVAIAANAFSGCSHITGIDIPSSVKTVGSYAFKNCTRLESIDVPYGVYSIGSSAFYGCNNLTILTIPGSIDTINKDMFSGLTTIEHLKIGDGVTEIAEATFKDYTSLKSVSIPGSVKVINKETFKDCSNLSEVTIGYGVTSIGVNAFWGCTELKSIAIPNSTTEVLTCAFAHCTNLKSISLSDRLTTISIGLFSHCSSLTEVSLPDSITSIRNLAFSECSGLESIIIPDGVTSIGPRAFSGCVSLKSVEIPDSVIDITGYTFEDCYSLTNVTLPVNITKIGNNCFFNCTSLTNVAIPNSVTLIGSYAFKGCTSLTNIVIPNSVISIGEWAFVDCVSLTNIVIPDNVTSIGHDAFSGCNGLTNVEIYGNLTNIGYGVFIQCTNLENVLISKGATQIGDRMFANCTKLKNVVIPDGLITIGNGAFGACASLTSIAIPDSVMSIGGSAFNACTSLTNIVIPEGLTAMKYGVFGSCRSLKSITIPVSVTTIEDSAFKNCNSLSDVYYGGSEADWKKISIGKENTCLTNAKIHYYSFETNAKYRSELIEDAQIDVYFSNDFFVKNTAYTYNHDLAKASLALELSSGTPKKNANDSDDDRQFSESDRRRNISNLYDNLGFKDVDYHNYDVSLSDNSDKVAYSFATKELYDGCKLVAVVVRGSGYGAEWRSNFHVGTGSKHEGFNTAAEEVYSDLFSYLSSRGLSHNDNVKLWITGYSRGAAVANIVAGRINETGLVNSRNMYAYTFATPNGVKVAETGASNPVHDNIYNIILPYDFIPKVAPEIWGYGRYGQSNIVYTVNTSDETTPHEQYFRKITGQKYSVDISNVRDANNAAKLLATFAKNQDYYAEQYEGLIMDLIEWLMCRKHYQSLNKFIDERYIDHPDFYDATMFELRKPARYILNYPGIYKLLYLNGLGSISDEVLYPILDALTQEMDWLETLRFAGGVTSVTDAHNPEYYISWIYGYDTPQYEYTVSYDYTPVYKKLTIACPVNVKVYDSAGTLVASVVDNEVVEDTLAVDVIGESAEIYFYDGEDIDDYTIEIEAYDDGNVNYSVTEYENNYVETRKINYANIPVTTGTKLSGNVPKGQKLEAEVYNLTTVVDEVETTIEYAEELSGENLQNLTVNVTVEGDGIANSVYFITKGEIVTVEAKPYHDATFIGWYSKDGELLSEDEVYNFVVFGDTDIVAKFTKCTAKTYFTNILSVTESALAVETEVVAGKDIEGYLYIAVYDENSKLLALNNIEVSLSEDSKTPVSKTFDTTQFTSDAKYVKVFVWSDECVPLSLVTKGTIFNK